MLKFISDRYRPDSNPVGDIDLSRMLDGLVPLSVSKRFPVESTLYSTQSMSSTNGLKIISTRAEFEPTSFVLASRKHLTIRPPSPVIPQ